MSKYEVKLEQFTGPLHLLLELIQERKLDITTVSIAQVAEQFLNYLQTQPAIDPEVAADFLVVAAKLMLIKSRALLPEFSAQAEEEASDLERQLKLYREFVEASKILEQIIKQGKFTYPRPANVRLWQPRFSPPVNIQASWLQHAFEQSQRQIRAFLAIPKKVMIKVKTVAERFSELLKLITKRSQLTFSQLLNNRQSRIERVLNFLALLELVKQAVVEVKQHEHHGEILIQTRQQ